MTLYKGTTAIAGIPTGLIDTVNGKADANNVYTKTEIDARPYLKTTYINGTSGYNIWSNGYCEQWGYTIGTGDVSGSTHQTITFVKTFKDTNYNMEGSELAGSINYNYFNLLTEKSRTVNTIVYYGSVTRYWKACGYLAEGEY